MTTVLLDEEYPWRYSSIRGGAALSSRFRPEGK